MNYHDITTCDLANGEGCGTVLWVAGCSHHCKNCHNPQTWDINSGVKFDEKAEKELFNNLSDPDISRLTFSGGDPLNIHNRDTILQIAKKVKEKFPEKIIWLYTGYEWKDIKDLELLKFIDVLIDGKYRDELSKPSPKWRGSSNQKIIDVQLSIKENKIIERTDLI